MKKLYFILALAASYAMLNTQCTRKPETQIERYHREREQYIENYNKHLDTLKDNIYEMRMGIADSLIDAYYDMDELLME